MDSFPFPARTMKNKHLLATADGTTEAATRHRSLGPSDNTTTTSRCGGRGEGRSFGGPSVESVFCWLSPRSPAPLASLPSPSSGRKRTQRRQPLSVERGAVLHSALSPCPLHPRSERRKKGGEASPATVPSGKSQPPQCWLASYAECTEQRRTPPSPERGAGAVGGEGPPGQRLGGQSRPASHAWRHSLSAPNLSLVPAPSTGPLSATRCLSARRRRPLSALTSRMSASVSPTFHAR